MKFPFSNPFNNNSLNAKASATHKLPQQGLMAIAALARPKWTQRRYDSAVEEGFRKNVVAWRCVTLIASAAASIPFTLYDSKNKIISKHALLKILTRPNPLASGVDFLTALYTSFLLAGNVYIEAVRADDDAPPQELYQLRPDRMKIVPGPAGLPLGFDYTLGSNTHRWTADAITGACDIMHWKNINPLDDWYGIAPLEAALISIDQHNAAGAWNQALLGQAARPSGALLYKPKEGPSTLTNDQLSRLREEFDSYYSGARAAGRPMILEGGLEWQSLSLSPSEMDWLRGREAAARDIALAFGVPGQLIGLPGNQTYNNMAEARLAFYEETVLPLALRLTAALNAWLLPMFDDGLRLEADTDEISALAPRREAIWNKVNSAAFLTINEKRLALGYPPIANGDQTASINGGA